jgi:hypothetical protein
MKTLLKKLVPQAFWPSVYLKKMVRKKSGERVMGGPFAGLKYVSHSCGSAFIPKLLGIYERELHPVLNQIIATRFERIIDVGAAEGYYAVGLAARLPASFVMAFEMESEGRLLLREMALANGVAERIEIHGRCGVEELQKVLEETKGRTLLICDCEGYEDELLDPKKIPALRTAHILVELHEFVLRGLGERLRARFKPSHMIETIGSQVRDIEEFPFSDWLTKLTPKKYLEWAVCEYRPEQMHWFWMQPKDEISPLRPD